jgi:hypothetical protein
MLTLILQSVCCRDRTRKGASIKGRIEMKLFCLLTVSAVALITAGAAQAQTTGTIPIPPLPRRRRPIRPAMRDRRHRRAPLDQPAAHRRRRHRAYRPGSGQEGHQRRRAAPVRHALAHREHHRPGQCLQHPRHRQDRADQRHWRRRRHLSRWRRHAARLFPGRALLRHRQRRSAARPAGHLRRWQRDRRRGVHHREEPRSRQRQWLCASRSTAITTTSSSRAR